MNSAARLIVLLALLAAGHPSLRAASADAAHVGAWRVSGDTERVMILTTNYWTQAVFDREPAKFLHTFGGPYTHRDGSIEGRIHFHSEDPGRVGSPFRAELRAQGAELRFAQDGREEVWTRIDAADSPLAGTWRINGRHVDGAFREMPLRARRTLKILSGTRFQWVAMNIETGQFSGTGGGTYTFEDGKYVENIDFFSRDASRVGARLPFEADVSGDTWNHRGFSSAGDPMHEVWVRFDPSAN